LSARHVSNARPTHGHQFDEIPLVRTGGLFAALAVTGFGSFYYCYELPARADLAAKEGSLQSMRAEIEKGTATERKLPEFRSQVEELEQRLAGLTEVLPREKDAADLLRQMQATAVDSSLIIRSFKPAPVVIRELHAEWPITLELDGTYHNLARFFDRLGKFSRIVNVSGLAVKGKDKTDSRSTITASCTATTFVLLDKPTVKKGARPDDKTAAAPKKAA
jgi:type IV pilus assembly protein PilO